MEIIVEAFFSGCISKVINDGKDYSWAKIKRAINGKNNRNISTKIYRVIERALNIVTDKKFKDTDKLYNAIERIFNEFKNNGDSLKSVKCGLSLLDTDVSDQRCENFLEKFYEGIRQDDDLYKAINMILQQNGIKINQEEFQKLNEKFDHLTEILSNRNDNKIDIQKRDLVKSRTQEYADKWNENMFLNNFDEWDENAGVNVKLSDVYFEEHLPHFTWGSNKSESNNLKKFLYKYIYNKKDNKMLLILGQPGIGKSTLITWITANFTDRVDDILVYKIASDLEDIDWQNSRVSNRILKKLGFEYKDLNGKTLILDGFDEVNIGSSRRDVLDCLYGDLIYEKHIKKFTLIVTCRENYVQGIDRVKSRYITLQPWDVEQIKSFCNVFQEKTKNKVSEGTMKKIIENRDILGIPLILYMTVALNISIEKEGSIVDIYDKIFTLEGGIYDRCINNKNFAEKHRIAEIKEQIHQISRGIAIWMFENNPARAFIPKEEYYKVCNNIMEKQERKNNEVGQVFLIGNYFKEVKHCEGIDSVELYFVHRSIYEYFVAETICNSMSKAVNESEESLACIFGELLKQRALSKEILQYLKYKIKKSSLNSQFCKIDNAFKLMLKNGMTYYTKEHYKNIIECELMVFKNMLEIVHIWDEICNLKFNYLVWDFLKYNEYSGLNLSGMVFVSGKDKLIGRINLSKSADLPRVYLRGANLTGTCLREADLTRADLRLAKILNADFSETNFSGADLVDADLRGTNLAGTNFQGADLRGTILDDNKVNYLEKVCDLQDVKICLKETSKMISYEEYCNRK